MRSTFFFFVLPLVLPFCLQAQQNIEDYFTRIEVRTDTTAYQWRTDRYWIAGEDRLPFLYEETSTELELNLQIRRGLERNWRLVPNPNSYQVLDSLQWIDGRLLGRIRLLKLEQQQYLRLRLAAPSGVEISIPLLPCAPTQLSWRNPPPNIFIGEEYSFDLSSNFPANIRVISNWQTSGPLQYRLRRRDNGDLQLQLQATRLGLQRLRVPLRLSTARLQNGQPVFELPPLTHQLLVQPARLGFLAASPREVLLDRNSRTREVEIEIDDAPELRLNKTYRLEDQEEIGGHLIAELIAQRRLANGRLQATFRPYDYHRREDGYLFLKDGDSTLFLTNLDIRPQTEIQQIEIQRPGADFTGGNQIYPGEAISIRLRGQSLHRSRFEIPGLTALEQDSSRSTASEQVYRATVPATIAERRLPIIGPDGETGQYLQVVEFSRPHPLNFLDLRVEGRQYELADALQLNFVSTKVADIIVGLRPDLIDRDALHGPQYIEIEAEVRDQRNRLIDRRSQQYTICPERSVRSSFYGELRCQSEPISISQLIRRGIFGLDPWTKISLRIRHQTNRYPGDPGFESRIEFVLSQRSTFDIDVSFPAGLVIQRAGESGFGNLGGISLATIAQFSFFQPNKIAQTKPYKFGVGFLALDAFNFSDNSNNRDLGAVALLSLYPLRTEYSSRLSFPLYLGGGYFLNDRKWFFVFGPGIRVRL
ncbi:MAG: hypothetical protein AAF433_09540 [Bacteroidota bacterium]